MTDFISIILPVYKQEKTIKQNIIEIIQSLKKANIEFELIAVVDGKVDDSYNIIKKLNYPSVKAFQLEINHGKGYAIRYGIARSRSQLVGFIDAGGELDPGSLINLINMLKEKKADIVIGSKRHSGSKVNYPPLRRFLSFGYQTLVYILFGLHIRDTQVGLKVFRRKVLEDVMPRLLVKRYAFDIEILAVANYLGYKKIIEAPIILNYDFKSLTSAASLSVIRNMLTDTVAVFYRLRIRHYYDTGNQRKWVYDKDLDFKVNVG